MILETQRLIVRRLTEEDVKFVLKLVNEPSFLSNIGDKDVRNLEDAKKFIQKGPWTCQEKPGYGQFLVELKENGVPVGVCGVLYREALDVSDIGFAFLPQYWGCGYGFEAANEMMRYGYLTLGIERIVGLTSKENLSSIKVLTKLGMKYERVVKMSDDDPGTVIYS